MKKLLIILLSILLVVLVYFFLFNGVKIGKLEILSVKQIIANNENLEQKITSTTKSITSDYPKAISDLNGSTKELMQSKNNYLDLASVSSDAEISKAVQDVSYKIDYLWATVGNHATKEGVNMKMEPVSGDLSGTRNLNFTITGSYIGIINFIYAIENDSDLAFKIETFKLAPGSSATDLQATFVVKNINVKIENVQSSVSSGSTSSGTEPTNNTPDAKTSDMNTNKDKTPENNTNS